MIEFKGLTIAKEVKSFIKLHQSVVPNDTTTREIIMTVKIHNQVSNLDLEQPNQNPLVFYASDIDSTPVSFSIIENIYNLEKDEEAML